MNLYLPKECEIFKFLYEALPPAVLGGGIVDFIYLEDISKEKVIKDIDIKINKSDFELFLIPYLNSSGNIKGKGFNLRKIEIDSQGHPFSGDMLYCGNFRAKSIDIFIVEEKSEYNEVEIFCFKVKIETKEARKKNINKILNIDLMENHRDYNWLAKKKKSFSEKIKLYEDIHPK
jgi:hypothetical protein